MRYRYADMLAAGTALVALLIALAMGLLRT